MNNRIGEFIGPFTVVRHDERSSIVAIDEDGVIKRYYTSQIRPFMAQPSVLDDAIVECDIEDRKTQATPKEDELMHEEDSLQLNVDSQSLTEQSVTDQNHSIQNERDEEAAKARETLKQTDKAIGNKSPNQRPDDATSTKTHHVELVANRATLLEV